MTISKLEFDAIVRHLHESTSTDDENELKFYYVESIDDYWIGQRLDNAYYADWHEGLGFVWSHSRYLPWGEHIVDENTLWKEHTYPSEPIEIPFTEWIVGFVKKYFAEPPCHYSEFYVTQLRGERDILQEMVKNMAEPKTGEWLEMGTNADGTHNIKCDQCGEGFKTKGHARSYYTKNKYKFCPKCGSFNGGEEE